MNVPHMLIRRVAHVALTLSLVGLMVASSSVVSRAQTQPSATSPLIRVGVGPDDQSTPLIYAAKAGLFAKAGLNVELVKLSGAAVVAAAIAGGSLELGKASPMAVITAYAKGLPFTVVGSAAYYTSETKDIALVVSVKSTIQTPKDLVGHTMAAVTWGDINSVATLQWLDDHNIDSASLKYIEVPASAAVAAMEQGRIEGSTLYEPVLSAALGAGKVRVLGYPFDSIAKKFSDAVIFGSTSWVANNPDLVQRFLKVVAESNAYVSTHESETAPLIAAFGGTDPTLIANMRHPARGVAISPADLQPVIDLAAKYKIIPKSYPASALICACAAKK